MSRLDILKASLEKKQAEFNRKLNEHFADVKRTNGQPLNDKRNGYSTMKRWDRQNDALPECRKRLKRLRQRLNGKKAE